MPADFRRSCKGYIVVDDPHVGTVEYKFTLFEAYDRGAFVWFDPDSLTTPSSAFLPWTTVRFVGFDRVDHPETEHP